jgi:hypothetical protein
MTDTTTTPAQILTARSESLSHRIDSGVAPEIYANAARLITEHERHAGLKFIPVTQDVEYGLTDALARWQADEDRNLGTAASRTMAKAVADLLAVIDHGN